MARAQQGVQSIEIGFALLRALAGSSGPLPLKSLAAAASMPAAKAHRYLVSLIRAGLVVQDAASGRYDLGPFALELGLAALGRIDPVRIGTEALHALRDRINETALLAVWGAGGPTIVRWVESTRPVTVNVRVGSTLSLLRSATGRVFLAHLPRTQTRAVLAREGRTVAPSAIERLRARTIRIGLGTVEGDALPGIAALAAPIFGHGGALALVIATLGPQGAFDVRPNGRIARELRACAAEASRRLGAQPVSDGASSAGSAGAR